MEWIFDTNDPLVETIMGSLMVILVIVLLTKLLGLRSFTKFTVYDFAFIVAIGSIISSILTSGTSIVHGSLAIASLLSLAYVFSILQKKIPVLGALLSNRPLLLMRGNLILEENLKHARIEKSQLLSKLREANVSCLNQIQAVVLEATADISVLHETLDKDGKSIDGILMEGVREKP